MPKTLLLADDSVVIQKLVALSFANEDVNLVTVYNGDEAVEKARECRPDVVLADVVMPGKNGYEVCEAIRQDPQLAHVPVLLLTGTFEAFDEDRASQAGSNGHITKPFEAQALVDRVNQLLASTTAPQNTATADASGAGAADEAYDFFDEELPVSSVAEEPPAALVDTPSDDVFVFGGADAPSLEPLSAEDAEELEFDVGGEHTVAMMDEAPSLDTGSDPLVGMSDRTDRLGEGDQPGEITVTASGLQNDAIVSEDSGAASFGSPEVAAQANVPDLATTVLADEAFASAGSSLPTGSPSRTDQSDQSDQSQAGPQAGPTQVGPTQAGQSQAGLTSDPEDLFASDPGASLGQPEIDSDLEFSFDGGTAMSEEVPPELDLAREAGLAPLPEAELDPAGSSAYDVSISDLGDSFSLDVGSAGGATAPEASIATPPPLPSGASSVAGDLTGDPTFATSQPESAPFETPPAVEFASSSEAAALPSPAETADDISWPIEETPAPELPIVTADSLEDSFSAAPAAALQSDDGPASNDLDPIFGGGHDRDADRVILAPTRGNEPIPATTAGADLSDVMRDRIHETLEKVAWEAFADLSDTIVRQVLERVEQVAWEVIPQMAETLIQDEIRKIKGDDDA